MLKIIGDYEHTNQNYYETPLYTYLFEKKEETGQYQVLKCMYTSRSLTYC